MNLYSINVKLAATMYIMADSEDEAIRIARSTKDDCLEMRENWDCDIPVTDVSFSDPEMPPLSIAQSMTCHGVFDDNETPELVEEDVESTMMPVDDEDEEQADAEG